jgi:hypothetical protein
LLLLLAGYKSGWDWFNNEAKDNDLFFSSVRAFFGAGARFILEEGSNSRFELVPILPESTWDDVSTSLLWSFNNLTDFCHALLTNATRSLIDASFGVPTHSLCFSMEPIAFPMPESFTLDLVTGRVTILDSKWSKRSTPPVEQNDVLACKRNATEVQSRFRYLTY